jgi:dipeptidyl aminopeptidase/acylaminoacyl peptidase
VARVRVPIAFTRIDRWLTGLIVLAIAAGAVLLWMSQMLVAPPRPRISDSKRPTIGLTLADDRGRVRIVSAAGPARQAGLKDGDTITAIGEETSPSVAAVTDRIQRAREGDAVRIEARRLGGGGAETGILADVKVESRAISPADAGIPFEDVSFRNADGLTLRGWYLRPPADVAGRAAAIAYGHGNATDRRHWLPVAGPVHDAGVAQLLFDFTGRGESDGEVISMGFHESRDLRAALDFLAARPEVDPLRLALGGRSMGAAAALFLAADDARVKALVLDSPYADLTEVVDRALASYSTPLLIFRPPLLAVAGWRAHYAPGSVRPIDAVRKIKAPILLFHGDKDAIVPYSDAARFKSLSAGPLTLVTLTGLDHNSTRPSDYARRIAAFLTQTMPPTRRTP